MATLDLDDNLSGSLLDDGPKATRCLVPDLDFEVRPAAIVLDDDHLARGLPVAKRGRKGGLRPEDAWVNLEFADEAEKIFVELELTCATHDHNIR